MIFQKTWWLILGGRKTQTARLKYHGDNLVDMRGKVIATARCRIRWRVGATMAVQPERCAASLGRILITDLFEFDPENVTPNEALGEGFESVEEFTTAWRELHPKPIGKVWGIGFKLVEITPTGKRTMAHNGLACAEIEKDE